MARPRGEALAIAKRRRMVAQLYLRRMTQIEIAEKLNISQATVSGDLKALKREWLEQSLDAVDEVRAREVAELDEMERDCALQFVGGKEDVWILRRLGLKERRAKLLGLDKPAKATVTINAITQLLDLLPEDLRDAVVELLGERAGAGADPGDSAPRGAPAVLAPE